MAVVGSAYIVVNAITTGFKDDIEDILDGLESKFAGAGRSFGMGFSRNAASSLSSFEREAIATYQSINALIEKSYYLQGAIGALIPIVASAAAGISVMAFEVAAAGPSFIVLGGVIAAFAQGLGAFKLAFSGVGKAIGSLTKPKGGIDKLPQLLRAASDAQDRYTDSQTRLKKATEALTDAREAARREIERLKYDNEDAVISEKRAVIELEKARESLLRVQDLPPNNRARREAELAFAEAELNLRKARTSTKDLQADLKKVTNDGAYSAQEEVENSKRVLDAKEAITEAQKAQNKAYDAKLLADKAVSDEKAGKGGGGGKDPMAGLNEYQKEFAKFIAGLKPQLDKLKLSVSEGLLPALQDAITLIDTKLFSTIDSKLKGTGVALGKAAKDFAERITSPNAIKNLATIMDTNNYVLSNTGIVLGNLARLVEALLAAADPLIRRFTDWIRDLTGGWAKQAEGNISGLTAMFNHAGDIAAGFGDVIGNIVGALMNIGRAITGSDGAGQTFLDWIIDLSQRFEDFTAKHLASGKLQEYFQVAFDGFKGILTIIGNIIQAILRTGGDKSLDGMVKNIGEGVGTLIEKMPQMIEAGAAFADFLGKFLGMTATFLESGSVQAFFGVVGKAIEILTAFLNLPGVSKILLYVAALHGMRLGIGRVAKGFETAGKYIAGDYFNFKKLKDGVVTFGKGAKSAYETIALKSMYAWDAIKKAGTAIKSSAAYTKLASGATKVWTGIQAAFNAVMNANPITLIVIGIGLLIAALVLAYFKIEWFRNFVDAAFDKIVDIVKTVAEWLGGVLSAMWDPIKTGLGIAWDFIKSVGGMIVDFFAGIWGGIKAAWDAVWPALVIAFKIAVGLIMLPFILMGLAIIGIWKGLKAAWDLVWPLIYNSVQWAWDNVIKPVFEIFGIVAGAVWGAMQVAFETAWNIITTSIDFAWNNVIKPIFELFGAVWGLVWEGIKLYYKTVWDIITTGISFAWNYIIKPVFEFFGSVWKTVWDGIKTAFTFVWDYVKGLITFYWEKVIKPVFGFIGEVWGKVWDGIKTAFTKAWNFITGVIDGAKAVFGKIGDVIINAFKSAINFIIRAWNNIEFKVPSVTLFGKTVGGFTLGLPDLPELAAGGVIKPSPGGTLARIGEAGRAERVEPLDQDGLSKRDRAIISMLAGGQGGVTVNVHPSPGMDEIELASVVSRQLALQLRRGAA